MTSSIRQPHVSSDIGSRNCKAVKIEFLVVLALAFALLLLQLSIGLVRSWVGIYLTMRLNLQQMEKVLINLLGLPKCYSGVHPRSPIP